MVGVLALAVASKQNRSATLALALEPVRGQGIETLRLGPGRHVIGSSAECSHPLRTAGVQPRHCEIRVDAGRATLRALDFRTWLNNAPVRQADLRPGRPRPWCPRRRRNSSFKPSSAMRKWKTGWSTWKAGLPSAPRSLIPAAGP